jgi:hypothetical protein
MGNAPRARRKVNDRSTAASATGPKGRPWAKYLIGLGILAAIVVGVIYISADVASAPKGDVEPPPGTEIIPINEASHTLEPIAYALNPPAGGNHNPEWLTCRAYDAPVRNENAVHSLEHGAIWITYEPGLDEDSIDDLERFTRRDEVMVSPYPGLDAPVVVTSWGRQLRLESADTGLIGQFYDAFHDKTAPENGAGC